MPRSKKAKAYRKNRPLREIRVNGKLPKFAWPGGYPMFYLSKQGNTLCPDCANADHGYEDPPIAGDVNWEDPDLYCDDCSERIESAYAEKD